MERYSHTIPPVYNSDSKILILGSFPSVKSREGEFFYHHPKNRFWKVMSAITHSKEPMTIEDKKMLLLSNRIALWDVIQSCDVIGSSDSSIKNVVVNELNFILEESQIQQIFLNGGMAYRLYQKFMKEKYDFEGIQLPSTSPANAAIHLEELIQRWSIIEKYLSL